MRAVLPVAVMIPFLLLAQLPANEAEAERPVSITITLETFEADVLWNASEQHVNFNGTLTLDDPLQREVDVSLFVSVPPGWSGTCDPAVNQFYHAGERPFTCNVRLAAQTVNMTANITIQGMAYWRGDVVASNQSAPFTVRVTRLLVEKPYNMSNPHKIDFTTRLENILPQLTVLSVLVAAVAVVVVGWRWRRKKKGAQE